MDNKKQFYIYGRQPVFEALRSSHTVLKVYIAENTAGKIIGKIRNLCQTREIPFENIDKNALQKFVGPVVHQGVVALVDFQPFLDESRWERLITSQSDPVVLVLDQIQDPHNLGAILRTAEITGVDCIVLPEKGSAPLNATVAKTSAGALFYSKFYLTHSPEQTLQALLEANFSVFAAVPSAEQNIYNVNFKTKTALVIGSEDKGVRKHLRNFCSQSVKIPQFGKVNSLNASVSTAVILYEIVRQRHFET